MKDNKKKYKIIIINKIQNNNYKKNYDYINIMHSNKIRNVCVCVCVCVFYYIIQLQKSVRLKYCVLSDKTLNIVFCQIKRHGL